VTDDSSNTGRRRFLVGSSSVVSAAGIAGAAVPFVGSWNPSAKARAAGAPVRIDISRLQNGEMLGPIPAWRGRPIFIVKRSREVLMALNEDLGRLADPDSQEPEQPEYAQNEYRSRIPELMVLVGLCPHLFCSPTPHIQLRP
jgi:ubiquinol-cytochrome c reductase iron-sulfur subunit